MTGQRSFPFIEAPAHTEDSLGIFDPSPVIGKAATTNGTPTVKTYSWYELFTVVAESLDPAGEVIVQATLPDGQTTVTPPEDRQVMYDVSVQGLEAEIFIHALCDRVTGSVDSNSY